MLTMLATLPNQLFKDRLTFEQELDKAAKSEGIKLAPPLRKAILSALAERDESAEPCLDKDGNPEPDPELRDTENVPLDQAIQTYFEREVLPYVSDAWVNTTIRDQKDSHVGKVGYEINFNRYFYKYQQKIHGLARSLGIKPIEMAEILTEVNFTRSVEYPGFPERSNAIYLPLFGRGDVITNLSQATLKHLSSYVQLVLNPDKAVDLYVAGFFNTELGRLIREQMMRGRSVPKVQPKLISQARIYLPTLEIQLKTIEANTKITDLVSELRDLQDSVWSQPFSLRETFRKIETVNHIERFSDWLDILPYPLASILWVYRATEIDYKRAYEHLLHFFEALAQFLATILLSGFFTDEELFQAKHKQLQEILPRGAFKRSTFGTWVRIVENLAKDGRTMLNSNEESQSRCKIMFSTLDREILDVLFSRKIIPILQKTNEYRNEWTGHGGIVNRSDAQNRHTILASYLAELRSVFGTGWKNYELIRAGANRYFKGVYHYDVERLVGHGEPFVERQIKIDVPMEFGQLYFLSTGERKPLKLLPLISVMASPKTDQDACYFYNRVQSDGIRFISYHFNAESEIVDTFKDTSDTLYLLSNPIKIEN